MIPLAGEPQGWGWVIVFYIVAFAAVVIVLVAGIRLLKNRRG